jgi:uncharacterized membrane protein
MSLQMCRYNILTNNANIDLNTILFNIRLKTDFLQNYKHVKIFQCSIEPINLKYNKMEKKTNLECLP